MKRMRVRFSDDAKRDILEQCEWYEKRAGSALALRWMDQIDAAVRRIARNPHSGAPCTFPAPELRLARRIGITKFPKHLIFYSVEDGRTEVLRVLHGARDLENLL